MRGHGFFSYDSVREAADRRPRRLSEVLTPKPAPAVAGISRCAAAPTSAEQVRFEPLTDRSLQTKRGPAQCDTPPLLPEQG